ncbi:hypothetical protein P5616_010625 [Priestia aryabhattai]|uniref:hypothetical protein n=1 Tax=Priestia aryabhattai TaxID=412384 RepID=UPI0024531958|nr:hypothetical protein [Priestia aryabhattai]MDH3133591.1 hypothetical protein [Priestia aryabhattai]
MVKRYGETKSLVTEEVLKRLENESYKKVAKFYRIGADILKRVLNENSIIYNHTNKKWEMIKEDIPKKLDIFGKTKVVGDKMLVWCTYCNDYRDIKEVQGNKNSPDSEYGKVCNLHYKIITAYRNRIKDMKLNDNLPSKGRLYFLNKTAWMKEIESIYKKQGGKCANFNNCKKYLNGYSSENRTMEFDKKNPFYGYQEGNIQILCRMCNTLKNDLYIVNGRLKSVECGDIKTTDVRGILENIDSTEEANLLSLQKIHILLNEDIVTNYRGEVTNGIKLDKKVQVSKSIKISELYNSLKAGNSVRKLAESYGHTEKFFRRKMNEVGFIHDRQKKWQLKNGVELSGTIEIRGKIKDTPEGLKVWCGYCQGYRPIEEVQGNKTSEYKGQKYGVYCNFHTRVLNAYKNRVDEYREKGGREIEFTKEEWINRIGELYKMQEGKCANRKCCRELNGFSMEGRSLAIDRKNPLIGYREGNLQLLCKMCNQLKTDIYIVDGKLKSRSCGQILYTDITPILVHLTQSEGVSLENIYNNTPTLLKR